MRKVTYGAACSLDGYIAAADGAVDWLHFSRDVQAFMEAYWPTVDTILVGRGTWEFNARQDAGEAPSLPGVKTYLFSRTLDDVTRPGVQLVRGDAGAFVRKLKTEPGKDICVLGGGVLGTSLLEAGVVDEVGMNVHPVLLGSGIPLFRNITRRIPLELIETRQMDGGCVLCTYRVTAH
jgi:dihydrofolate reductase